MLFSSLFFFYTESFCRGLSMETHREPYNTKCMFLKGKLQGRRDTFKVEVYANNSALSSIFWLNAIEVTKSVKSKGNDGAKLYYYHLKGEKVVRISMKRQKYDFCPSAPYSSTYFFFKAWRIFFSSSISLPQFTLQLWEEAMRIEYLKRILKGQLYMWRCRGILEWTLDSGSMGCGFDSRQCLALFVLQQDTSSTLLLSTQVYKWVPGMMRTLFVVWIGIVMALLKWRLATILLMEWKLVHGI